MKSKFILSLMILLLGVSFSYASFPVQRTATTSTTVNTGIDAADVEVVLESPAAAAANDTLLISLLLWFFLGWAAGHRWYLGSPIGWNILFILTLGGLGVWWLVDGIQIILGTY